MTRNTVSLAGFISKVPKPGVTSGNLAYTTFDLITLGSYRNKSGREVGYHDHHHIVCVGSLDQLARSLPGGSHIELEGELRTRRHTTYDGRDPVEIQVTHWRLEVVAASIRLKGSDDAIKQEEDVNQVLIALYRPEEI